MDASTSKVEPAPYDVEGDEEYDEEYGDDDVRINLDVDDEDEDEVEDENENENENEGERGKRKGDQSAGKRKTMSSAFAKLLGKKSKTSVPILSVSGREN